MRGVRHLLRNLTGRLEEDLVRLALIQLDATVQGAELVREMVLGEVPPTRARARINEIEDAGDAGRAALISELSRALSSPIDREDIFRLSRSIDDILDNLRDFVRAADLFDIHGPAHLLAVVETVVAAVLQLRPAVESLAHGAITIAEQALAAKKAGNQVRRSFDEAMAGLLEDPVTAEMLKRRELLRRLDVVGLRLGEAADALADGAMKRGI